MASLLRDNNIIITPQISMKVALIGEILDYGEKEYYSLLTSLIITPYEVMAQLFLAGVDYEEIDEYDLFIDSFIKCKNDRTDMSILFNNIVMENFNITKNKNTNEMVLYDQKNNITIDRVTYTLISMNIRKMLFSKPPKQKAGNNEAKEYMIERAVIKYKRQLNKEYKPFLENTIIALTNTEQYKYNYEETMNLSIYTFNASVRQVLKKINYDNIITGIYAGTINSKEISMNEINWLPID